MRIEELSMGSVNSPSGAAVDTPASPGTFVTLLLAGEPDSKLLALPYISVTVGFAAIPNLDLAPCMGASAINAKHASVDLSPGQRLILSDIKMVFNRVWCITCSMRVYRVFFFLHLDDTLLYSISS